MSSDYKFEILEAVFSLYNRFSDAFRSKTSSRKIIIDCRRSNYVE
jgi:hypothetical protein